MEYEKICQNCSKRYYTRDEDSIICDDCFYEMLKDFYEQLGLSLR